MYKSIKRKDENYELPNMEQVVMGFDEWDKEERLVRYRHDSNRFFDEPYTGAVYPKDRMHRWRNI